MLVYKFVFAGCILSLGFCYFFFWILIKSYDCLLPVLLTCSTIVFTVVCGGGLGYWDKLGKEIWIRRLCYPLEMELKRKGN